MKKAIIVAGSQYHRGFITDPRSNYAVACILGSPLYTPDDAVTLKNGDMVIYYKPQDLATYLPIDTIRIDGVLFTAYGTHINFMDFDHTELGGVDVFPLTPDELQDHLCDSDTPYPFERRSINSSSSYTFGGEWADNNGLLHCPDLGLIGLPFKWEALKSPDGFTHYVRLILGDMSFIATTQFQVPYAEWEHQIHLPYCKALDEITDEIVTTKDLLDSSPDYYKATIQHALNSRRWTKQYDDDDEIIISLDLIIYEEQQYFTLRKKENV